MFSSEFSSYLDIYNVAIMEIPWSYSRNIEGPAHRQQGQQQKGPPPHLQSGHMLDLTMNSMRVSVVLCAHSGMKVEKQVPAA